MFKKSCKEKLCTFMREERRRSAAFTVVSSWCMYTSESKRSLNNTVSGWIYNEALQNQWSQILFMLIQLFLLFWSLLSPLTSNCTACCLDSSIKISQSTSEKRLYQVLLQINVYQLYFFPEFWPLFFFFCFQACIGESTGQLHVLSQDILQIWK